METLKDFLRYISTNNTDYNLWQYWDDISIVFNELYEGPAIIIWYNEETFDFINKHKPTATKTIYDNDLIAVYYI